MTPASIGAQLEERRVTRIRDVLDFPEELESRENCGESPRDLSSRARDPHLEPGGKGAAGSNKEGSPGAGSKVRCHTVKPVGCQGLPHLQGSSSAPTCRMSGNLESLWTAMGSRGCLLD